MSYEAISKLGEGGFGSVWKMKTPKNQLFSKDHPIVALKRIKSPDARDKEEVEILKKLDHCDIIKYLDSVIRHLFPIDIYSYDIYSMNIYS